MGSLIRSCVFIAVYWPRVLGNFIYIVRVKMATGNSAKQQWASLNTKHFFSNISPSVDLLLNIHVIRRQVKYGRFKNDNFGSDEK